MRWRKREHGGGKFGKLEIDGIISEDERGRVE